MLPRLRYRFTGLALASGLIIVSACQWLVGIGDKSLYDGGGGDAGEAGVDPCMAPDLPPNPGPNTSSPSDSVTFTAALSQVMLGTTDGGPYYGFNLDKVCTCPESDSCTRSGGPACDDPMGIDNYARRIFEQVNELAMLGGLDAGFITEAKLNAAVQTGISGAMIQISSYNGKADDGIVTVQVLGSLGAENPPPKFDGTDKWYVDPTATGVTYSAYVANYTLVAPMDFPIIIGSSTTQPVYIQLTSGVIRADLKLDGMGNLVSMTGSLGGRWDPAKFLPSLAVIPDPLMSGQYLCPDGSATYTILKSKICQNTDVAGNPADDFTGLCDAVSMGLGFVATPAIQGSNKSAPDSGSPCQGNTDHCQ